MFRLRSSPVLAFAADPYGTRIELIQPARRSTPA
jgi:hypothetical protein